MNYVALSAEECPDLWGLKRRLYIIKSRHRDDLKTLTPQQNHVSAVAPATRRHDTQF